MNLPNRESLLSCFSKVPREGLEHIFPHLQNFGVLLEAREWDLHVDGEYPHAYYNTAGHYRLAVGVTPTPTGYQSWCALTDGPYGDRHPPTLRLMIHPDGACTLEIVSGQQVWTEPMRELCRQYFKAAVYSVAFEPGGLPALIERFCELVHV